MVDFWLRFEPKFFFKAPQMGGWGVDYHPKWGVGGLKTGIENEILSLQSPPLGGLGGKIRVLGG